MSREECDAFQSYNIDLQSSRRYNIDLKLSQWFRLNKGSNVTLTWETSKIVYFTIYNACKEIFLFLILIQEKLNLPNSFLQIHSNN